MYDWAKYFTILSVTIKWNEKMKPDSTILAYLRGEKFSNGTSIHIYSRKEVFKEKSSINRRDCI